MKTQPFKKSVLFAALSSALYQPMVQAQSESKAEEGIEKIQVTATRRSATVQEIPVNITALGGDLIDKQNISELADVARWVPGLTVQDQGGRAGSPIIVRGLNTNSSGPDSDGGTVATYVDESPLAVDLKLLDIDRVEVLIGPQGTLYGAGTLGGAIRYISNKPVLDETTIKVYGEVNSVTEGGQGHEAGFVFNTPLISDELGIRVAYQQQKNAGFIDYAAVVKDVGVSLPDPDWTDAAAVNANTQRIEDVNSDETTTAKIMMRWTPSDDLNMLLSYTYQEQEVGGRSIVHYGTLADSNGLSDVLGKYDSGYRVVEPRDKTTDLLALEITADLGIAELTSATSLSSFEAVGQRDQTDLLIRLNYSYEEFPAFTSFTREDDEEESFTQELRLVSTADSDLTWIAGFYYSDLTSKGDSREYTPGFGEFGVADWGAAASRPDALEYLSVGETDITESALFGEISYAVTDQLDLTFGARFYDYEVESVSAIDFPLLYTMWGKARRDENGDEIDRYYYQPDELWGAQGPDWAKDGLDVAEPISAEDSGTLLKFNVSYKFTDDVMTYLTLSEGFRIGGSNGIGACPSVIPEGYQKICALPHEEVYVADTTSNLEFGVKSTWFKNKLHLNGAVYAVDWNDPQIGGATQNGQQPITANGEGASAKGFELSARARFSDYLTAFGSVSHTKAELTGDAPYLFGVFYDQGTDLQNWKDGSDGDRLPGSPETQASFGLTYTQEMFDEYLLDVNYGVTYQSDFITKVGLKDDGETLEGYSLSNLSARFSAETWSVTLFVDNLFDEYAITSARRTKADIGQSRYDEYNQNRPDLSRNYGYFIATPRTVGIKFDYKFESL